MVRVGLVLLMLMGLAASAVGHETAGMWPHPHDDEAAARPVRLEHFDALGGEFTLTDTDGRSWRLSDHRGQVLLLFFGYTHCPDACPLTVAKVRQTMQLLGAHRKSVQFVFITTDPERDTPARLSQWLRSFDPELVGLRGSAPQLAAIEQRYGVFHTQLPPQSEPQGYAINHTSRLFLIDPEGAVRYLFTPEQPAEAIAEGVRLALRPPSLWVRLIDLMAR